MKRILVAFTMLLIYLPAFSQEDSKLFPDDFLGIYKGTLSIDVPEKEVQEMSMELHLLATDTTDRYVYKLIYDGVPRNYNLLVVDAEKGLYEIDENNGIILPCRLRNNTLFSFFEVSGNFLSTRLAFSDGQMDFEVLFSPLSDKKRTGEETDYEIYGYPISTMQKAVLKRE